MYLLWHAKLVTIASRAPSFVMATATKQWWEHLFAETHPRTAWSQHHATSGENSREFSGPTQVPSTLYNDHHPKHLVHPDGGAFCKIAEFSKLARGRCEGKGIAMEMLLTGREMLLTGRVFKSKYLVALMKKLWFEPIYSLGARRRYNTHTRRQTRIRAVIHAHVLHYPKFVGSDAVPSQQQQQQEEEEEPRAPWSITVKTSGSEVLRPLGLPLLDACFALFRVRSFGRHTPPPPPHTPPHALSSTNPLAWPWQHLPDRCKIQSGDLHPALVHSTLQVRLRCQRSFEKCH